MSACRKQATSNRKPQSDLLPSLLAGAVLALNAGAAAAVQVVEGCFPFQTHCTDGGFNLHNGGSQTNDANEWGGRDTISKSFFPRVGDAGGAWLYAEQGFDGDRPVLYLMYDYVDPVLLPSFLDVFFQVKDEDYLVRITPNGFSVLVKPAAIPSNILPDGSFDTGDPWETEDFSEGRFVAATGFGPSPNNPIPHPMAEFELSVNSNAFESPNGPSNGLYDPAPAFWSASVGGGGEDPPISSGIFTLHADGTTTVVPVLDANGAPVLQGNVPEPGTAWLFGLGLFGLMRRFSRH